MNKKNKILVGCLALLLALSVGYALFSDTITINGTATAKGSFDVTADCTPGILSKLGTAEDFELLEEGGYKNDTCTVSDDVVSMNVNFAHPDSRRHFTVKFTNTGTIDATLKVSDIYKYESMEFCYSYNLEDEPTTCYNRPADMSTRWCVMDYCLESPYEFAAMSDKNDVLLSETEINNFFDNETRTITLKPGYSGYVVLSLGIYHDGTSFFGNIINAKITTVTEFPFNQVTN